MPSSPQRKAFSRRAMSAPCYRNGSLSQPVQKHKTHPVSFVGAAAPGSPHRTSRIYQTRTGEFVHGYEFACPCLFMKSVLRGGKTGISADRRGKMAPRPLRHPAVRYTPGATSPCAGEVCGGRWTPPHPSFGGALQAK